MPRSVGPLQPLRQVQQLQGSCRDLLINPGLNQVGLEEIINCLGRKLVVLLKANSRPAGRDQNKGEKVETPIWTFYICSAWLFSFRNSHNTLF